MSDVVRCSTTRALEDTLLVSESIDLPNKERAFLLLQIHSDANTGKTLKRECLSLLDHALASVEGELGERMDSALKELNGLIKGLLLSKSLDDLHAIIAVVGADGAMHVSHAGRAEAYVIRGGTASQITEYTRGKPSPSFVHIASGQLEPGDAVILSSQRLLRAVTPAQLAQLAAEQESLIPELKRTLESEGEQAALATIHVPGGTGQPSIAAPAKRGARNKKRSVSMPALSGIGSSLAGLGAKGSSLLKGVTFKGGNKKQAGNFVRGVTDFFEDLWKDLRDPKRKRRAHLLLIAGVLAIFLVVWSTARLSSLQQRGQAKAEQEAIIEKVNEDLRTADTRRIAGDFDSANALLDRAEGQAKQIISDESDFFRVEALDQLDRIRSKREEINNVVRILAPEAPINVATKKPSVDTVGLIGLGESEFIIFDKQDYYRVLNTDIGDPNRISEEELILAGTNFERFQTYVFQMTGNAIIELINDQPTSMKTDDPAGWIAGKAMETYLRYLYVLSPENNQIYRYERLSNRYGAPDQYNINADLANALDLAIDGNIFVLKEGGEILKLLRGETQPFTIRHLPEGALESATRIYKAPEGGNLYILDPVNHRVVIATDGGDTGESTYVNQYVLDNEMVDTPKDLWVDAEGSNLYVLDKKRLYRIALRQ